MPSLTYSVTTIFPHFFIVCVFIRSEAVAQGCSVRKGVLGNFSKLTGKHLYRSLFFRPQTCNFVKKETLTQVFSCEFSEISKNTLFTEHLWATASGLH